jgi:hypothetical protein
MCRVQLDQEALMRKQLLSMVFIFVLFVFAGKGSAQVLKGSEPADAKPKSTIKTSPANKDNAAMKNSANKKAPSMHPLTDGGSKDPAFKRSKTAPRPDALTVKQTNHIDTRATGVTPKPALGDGSLRLSKARTTRTDVTSGALNTTHGATLKQTAKAEPTKAGSQKATKKTLKQTTQPR